MVKENLLYDEKEFDFSVFEKEIYEPAEDTNLLLNSILDNQKIFLENSSDLNICEVGVGSGFISFLLAKKYSSNNYYGCDINPNALVNTEKNFSNLNKNIILSKESLFLGFEDIKFDLIIFNPPYLPCEDGESIENLDLEGVALYGGKKGYEVTLDFINGLYDHLKMSGSAYILVSSLSNKEYVEEYLERNLFSYEVVDSDYYFFEELFCIKITKSNTLIEIEEKGVLNFKYLSKGKHSVVFSGKYYIDNEFKDVIIKTGKKQHMSKEKHFLEYLKNEKFVPQIYDFSDEFVIREKFDGMLIDEFLKVDDKDKIVDVINNIFEITFRLDSLGINKFEMINPYKHIYIFNDYSVGFIDFERCIFTDKPKNTTQFFQYLRRNMSLLLDKDIIISEKKMYDISKNYKENIFLVTLNDLIE